MIVTGVLFEAKKHPRAHEKADMGVVFYRKG